MSASMPGPTKIEPATSRGGPSTRTRIRLGLSAWAIGVALVLALGGPTVAEAASTHVFGSSFGGSATTVVDPYPLGDPSDVAIDESSGGADDVYVTDPAHFRVEKFDSAGHLLLMFGKEVNKTKVDAGASDAEQNVCVAGSGEECQSGTQGGEGGGEFSDPRFVAVDSSQSASGGDVYVGDDGTKTLDKFAPDGSFISAANGSGAPQGPFSPGGLDGVTVDGGGRVWVFDHRGFAYRFAPDGSLLGPVLETRDGGSPGGIAVESTGALFAVSGSENVEKFGSEGQLIGRVTELPGFGGQPVSGVALNGSSGDLYVDLGAEIGRIAPGCDPSRGLCETADLFGFPHLGSGAGLAAEGSGNAVLVADTAAGAVDRFVAGIEATTGAAGEITAGEATVHGTVDPDGAEVTECLFEYGASTEYGRSAPCEGAVGSGTSSVGVQARLGGLEGGTTYHYRLFAKNSAGTVRAEDGTFMTAKTAVVEEALARDVAGGSAELAATINPEGLDAHYHFEYGTDTNYGTSVPVPGQDIGAGEGGVAASQTISGLQANTTYHFRVVVSDANGTSESADHTFVFLVPGHSACLNEALRPGLSADLPDCRGYELVTPPQKNSALIGALFFGVSFPQIAADGSRMIVPSLQCFAAAQSCVAHRQSEGELYEFSRASGSWQTTALAPPASRFQTETLWSWGPNTSGYLFSTPGPAEEDFYARLPDGSYRLIGPVGEGEVLFNLLSAGVLATSADFSHVVYGDEPSGSDPPIWSFDHSASHTRSLYEYTSASTAAPSLVAVSGGPGSTDLISTCRGTGLGAGTFSPANSYNPLSADGRIVYFTVGKCPTGSGVNAGKEVPAVSLYERVDQSPPIKVSSAVTATCTTAECEGSAAAAAVFEGASRNGEAVLFTSTQQLTDEANQDRHPGDSASLEGGSGCLGTSSSASGCNLYLSDCPDHCEDPSQRRLIDLSEGAKDTGGPMVQGTVAISPDGDDVYFVAKGALTATENERGEGAQIGAENLYHYERGEADPQGRLTFVARLSPLDQPNWAGGAPFQPGAAITSQGLGVANITPDGRYLVFTSIRALSPDAAPGPAQVYRYDSRTEEMTRISVGRQGFDDNGNAGRPGAGASIVPADNTYALASGPAHTNPTMSDDGSYVFFESPVGLTPGALNEVSIGNGELAPNVYEYHEGVVSLISDGKDVSETGTVHAHSPELLGTDASGQDVFLATNSQLTGKDTDTQRDYYDARIGGGEEAPISVPPCEGDACRGAATAPTGTPPPASAITGPDGNFTRRAPGMARHLKKALRTCRARYKTKAKKRAVCERGAHRRYGTGAGTKAKARKHQANAGPSGAGR
jgi:hypothetical protein